jgi:uncharacterized membrane protein (DUF485 family)
MRGAKETDRWTLRPGDLPAVRAPFLEGLEQNAVYRHLIHQHRRYRAQRLTMMVTYLGVWLALGPLYGHFILGADVLPALTRTAGLLIVLAIGIMNIYVLAGIEGYETNGWLKGRFFDVIESGIPAREIARGIIGKTVSHYPPHIVYPALLGTPFLLLTLMLGLPLGPMTVLYIWFLLLGVFGAFLLAGAFPWLAYLTTPGTLLWYHGVRRSYERRLAEQQGRRSSILMDLLRTTAFLAISVSSVVAPLVGFLMLGAVVNARLTHTWNRPDEHFTMVLVGFTIFAVLGLMCGAAIGWTARRLAPWFLSRLEREIETLFRIRGDVLFGG